MLKVLSVSNMNGHLQNQLTKSLERILEEAHLSGELKLSGRKLKDFPKTGGKYDLSDTVIADLSKNKFWELPSEVLEFLFIEKLHLYHNALRSLPDGLGSLQYLKFLDLSRNQLCALPSGLCQLEYLEVLLVANNKLSALPNDIGGMKNLMELNASCNEITHLPRSLGQLKYLKALDLRKNLLEELPIELTYLKLTLLDMGENRISSLPVELRLMTNLEQLKLNDNPLVSPPATICMRGRVHIFKFLETQVHKTDKKRCGTLEDVKRTQRKSDIRYPNGIATEMRVKRHTVDSGYSTSDGMDTKWAQDFRNGENVNKTKLKSESIPITNGEFQENVNGTFSGCSTPSTISPGESFNNDDELINKTILYQDQMEARRLIRLQSNDRGPYASKMKENLRPTNTVANGEAVSPASEISSTVNGSSNSDEKKRLEHVQTYREYKEARRLQRAQTQDVYRSKYSGDGPWNNPSPTSENSKLETDLNGVSNNQCNDSAPANTKKPVQKVTPSRNASFTNSLTNGDTCHIPSYVKPSSPIKGSTSLLGECSPKPASSPLSARLSTSSRPLSSSLSRFRSNPNSPRPAKWNTDIPADKLSFTMRREFEKAKEEAELIEQLRHHIESRLKMSLPEDMGPALMDGVVLCHLANHVRPRSVASIHVPSPAVPKLTMARCRRNVDNFLDACRKIGVEEEDLCSCEDVVETLRVGELLRTVEALLLVTGSILPPPKPADIKANNVSTNMICFASDILEGRGLVRVSITVAELLKFHTPKSPAHSTITAT